MAPRSKTYNSTCQHGTAGQWAPAPRIRWNDMTLYKWKWTCGVYGKNQKCMKLIWKRHDMKLDKSRWVDVKVKWSEERWRRNCNHVTLGYKIHLKWVEKARSKVKRDETMSANWIQKRTTWREIQWGQASRSQWGIAWLSDGEPFVVLVNRFQGALGIVDELARGYGKWHGVSADEERPYGWWWWWSHPSWKVLWTSWQYQVPIHRVSWILTGSWCIGWVRRRKEGSHCELLAGALELHCFIHLQLCLLPGWVWRCFEWVGGQSPGTKCWTGPLASIGGQHLFLHGGCTSSPAKGIVKEASTDCRTEWRRGAFAWTSLFWMASLCLSQWVPLSPCGRREQNSDTFTLDGQEGICGTRATFRACFVCCWRKCLYFRRWHRLVFGRGLACWGCQTDQRQCLPLHHAGGSFDGRAARSSRELEDYHDHGCGWNEEGPPAALLRCMMGLCSLHAAHMKKGFTESSCFASFIDVDFWVLCPQICCISIE